MRASVSPMLQPLQAYNHALDSLSSTTPTASMGDTVAVVIRKKNAKLGINLHADPDGSVRISSVCADGAAAMSGCVCAGDIVVTINGQPTAGRSVEDVIRLIAFHTLSVTLELKAPPHARFVTMTKAAGVPLGISFTGPAGFACDGAARIAKLHPGYTAACSGLAVGDCVLAINGVACCGVSAAGLERRGGEITGDITFRVQTPQFARDVLIPRAPGQKLGLCFKFMPDPTVRDATLPSYHLGVAEVVTGHAAANAGVLQVDDIVLSVNGQSTAGMQPEGLVQYLSQPPASLATEAHFSIVRLPPGAAATTSSTHGRARTAPTTQVFFTAEGPMVTTTEAQGGSDEDYHRV